ncbi:MAG: ankyrin repeat protein [Halioglobus sp.]|jgi:ankyrin repeat protein
MANIHDYIRSADIKTIQLEIENNPNCINEKDERGFPPIVLATYGQQVDATKLLIHSGVEIDQKDSAGNTALMGVTYKGNLEIVKLLIDAGADVNVSNYNNATPLIYAATFSQLRIAKMLIEKGANLDIKDARGNSAFDHAKMKGDQAMEELLKTD